MPIGHGDAGFLEAAGVFVALIPQGIGARGQHIGRRQADERARARRRSAPVVHVGGAVEVLIVEVSGHRMREQDAGLRLAVRRMVCAASVAG